MPRRKQGQLNCRTSATGGYLKKKADTGSELIENSFTTNNDLVYKIKKTLSSTISNAAYHEKIEREHIDAPTKSLNDPNMVSKYEVNNNSIELLKEQDENQNSRNVIVNCCGSAKASKESERSPKKDLEKPAFSNDRGRAVTESKRANKRSTDSSDFSPSQMSGVSPSVPSSDLGSDSQKMNYRVSTSVTESRSKDAIDPVVKEEQNCHLPSSVYGSPASSIEKVLTGLQVAEKTDAKEPFGKVSFLQEILQKKTSETVSSYDSLSRQFCGEADTPSSIAKSSDSKAPNKPFDTVQLKLHIPESFVNDDSNCSALSSDSQKPAKIPKITSPQILEQHISKIISENAAIVETLDPKWSRRYFKQSSLDSDLRRGSRSSRSEDTSMSPEVSKLQSALLGGSEFEASPLKLPNNLSAPVSEDELKGSAIKSLLSLKRGRCSLYFDKDIHPQNPEGSIIKDLLLKTKSKEGSGPDTDHKLNSSFLLDGNNVFYKSSILKCPNCSSEFSEKYSLDIHLSFCKPILSLRDDSEKVTFKESNAQKLNDGVGPILKKQLLLPLSKSPPIKRRKVSDSVLNTQSFGDPFLANPIGLHRSRSHSVHLFGGEVQIVDGDKTKRIKIQTSIPGAFTPITNKFADSFRIKKPGEDFKDLPSVVVTIAQPVHNSGGTVHLPPRRSPSVSPVVSIGTSLSDGIVKFSKSDYVKSLPLFGQKEPPLLNFSSQSLAFFPGPDNTSFPSGLPVSPNKLDDFKPGTVVEEISPIAIRVPGSPGTKPFYSPIFSTEEKSFESSAASFVKEKENANSRAVPTVVFTPSSPTSEVDVQSTSISEPVKKFLAPSRPTSLPLKKKPFTMVGSTLISPETPRPKKTCIQLYLNGHAYTYLGLKCSTRSTYCCIYRPQPMFVLQETNPKLSMYSNWQVVPAKEELSGLTPGQMISFYCSKQRRDIKSVVATAKMGEPLIFTHSSYWTYRSTDPSGNKKALEDSTSNQKEETELPLEKNQDPAIQTESNSPENNPAEESSLHVDTDNATSDPDVNNSEEEDDDEYQDDGTDSSQPKRIKIFEGGFKSNEDYTYVRGRGRGKYVCEECGIRCKKPSMLKKHIRTHTDLRPYKCKHCSFAFKTKGNLTKHMKSKAHHKKCTELGIIPVPTTTDDSQIDEEALAKQEQIEKKKTQFSDGEDADDDDDDTDETDDECESDTSSMIISNPNSRMLTNGHSKKTQDKVGVEQGEENRSESVSQQSEEQEAARSLLHLSAIGEPSQWSTSTGELTDVASSCDADSGSLVSRHDPTLLSPQYVTQTVTLPNSRSKVVSDQWLSTETLGHRPRSYSADIPLGGGKELLTKYRLVKGIASDANEKANVDGSEFGSKDQYTRRYSISVAREARKPRVIPAPEWNALGLPTPAPKWPETELPDQPMDLSISRDLGKYKSTYAGGTLLSVVTQEEAVPDRHLQTTLESCLSEQYQLKSLPVLSPQVVVDYETSVDSSSNETPLLSLTDDQNAFSSASRSVYYMQDVSSAENTAGRKESETTEDPPSPDIDYSACSPVSPTTLEENSYYYSQENIGHGSSSNEEIQSSARAHAEFIVPSSSSSMEEGKCVCRICNKIFAKSSHLRLHVNIHYFERPFRCDNCAVSFRTKGHLQKHKRSVSHYNKVNMNLTFGTPTVDNPRPFKCADCKIAFRIHGHLAKHLRSKMHIMKLECLGKLPFGMYAEMERSGVSLNEIDTTDCNNSLESLQVMAQKLYQRDPRRMRWQGPDQSSVETECTMPAPTVASTLLEPILPITDPIPTTFDPSCSAINLPLPSVATSKQLSESSDVKHEPSEVDSLRIPYTDGDSAISLSRYVISQPMNQETSQRVDVPESDSSVSLNRSGTCHMCGRLFKSAKFLQVHLYSDHSSLITSISDVPPSNSSVSSVASLDMNCDLCGKMFPNQKALQQHLLSHAQPRPFVCEICDAGFTSSSSLIAHQATHQITSSQSSVSETRLVQLK